jgi:hypothetical protein
MCCWQVAQARARVHSTRLRKGQGRILPIVDTKDDKFGSCKEHLTASVLPKEVAFDSGPGHAVSRSDDEKNIRLWKEPLVAWAKGS